jgi:hypothetical protein
LESNNAIFAHFTLLCWLFFFVKGFFSPSCVSGQPEYSQAVPASQREERLRGSKEGVVIVGGMLEPNKTKQKSLGLFNVFSLRFFLAKLAATP